MAITVVIDGVSRRFGERTALCEVSATAKPGKLLLVTGRNVSGKSTLLKIAAGLRRPSTGSVVYKDGTDDGAPELFSDRIGFASPELSLYDELSALDNLTFFGGLKGVKGSTARAEALLKRAGLLDRADDPLSSFSSGMKQRMKFCFSLMNEPDVWILDEPTANLDDAGKGLVYSLIGEMRRKSALIIATNEKEEVRLGNEVIELGR